MTQYARDVEFDPSGRLVPEWNVIPPDSAYRHSVECKRQLGEGVTVATFTWETDSGLTISSQVDDPAGETSAIITPPDPAAVEPVRYRQRVLATTSDGQTIVAGEGVITVAVRA